MQIMFLIMAARNPVWVLGALILSELTIRNYFFTLPAASLIVLPHLTSGVILGPKARLMFAVAGLFVAVAATNTFIVLDTSGTLTFLKSIAIDVAVFALIPLAIRSRNDLSQIGVIGLVIAGASATIAVAERFAGARFLAIPHYTQLNVDGVDWGTRSLGLDLNPILLTDHMMLFLFPIVGLLLMRGVPRQASVVLIAIALMMVGALFFSETRSWIFSTVAAIAAMAFVLRGRLGAEVILVLLVAGIGFFYWADISGSRYSFGPGSDTSAAARPVLWSAGLQMALDHPLIGVGTDQFKELAPQYANSIDRSLLERQDVGAVLGRISPHNDYLNVWLSFGLGGFILYGLLLIFTGANFVSVARGASDPLLQGIALGCLGALAAFCVNSFFHNLFTSALTVWILAGISVALTKLANPHEALRPALR